MEASLEQRATIDFSGSIVAALPWLVVTLFVAIGFYSISAPPGETNESDGFSTARAMNHIEVIAREPHPMGSPEIAEVRDYLVAELRSIGLEPDLQRLRAPDYYSTSGRTVDVVNVVARIPGERGNPAVALVAHYDTMTTTPGANDNTAAVAVLLETARLVVAGEPLANDIILLFTDGEEPAPRPGSNGFVESHPDAADIRFVVNFEALGGSGASMVAETSGPESWVIAEYATAVNDPVAFSFMPEIARMIGDIGTDFDPFRNAGVPGLHLVYMRGSSIYHTPADNIASVSLRSLEHHGNNAVGVVRRFGNLDLEETRTNTTSVYFTLRPAFVRYPAWLGWPVLFFAAGLLTTALRRSGMATGRVVATGGKRLLGAVGASLVGTLLWLAVTSIRTTPSALEGYGFLLLIGGSVVWLTNRNSDRLDPHQNRAAVAIVWLLLSLLTLVLLPATSYLFVWPALAVAIAANLQLTTRGRAIGFVGATAALALLLVPAIEFFWQSGQPRLGNPDSSIPAVAVGAFVLIALAGAALRSVWWRAERT